MKSKEHKLDIDLNQNGTGNVILDGKDISGITRKIIIKSSPDEGTRVILDVHVDKVKGKIKTKELKRREK